MKQDAYHIFYEPTGLGEPTPLSTVRINDVDVVGMSGQLSIPPDKVMQMWLLISGGATFRKLVSVSRLPSGTVRAFVRLLANNNVIIPRECAMSDSDKEILEAEEAEEVEGSDGVDGQDDEGLEGLEESESSPQVTQLEKLNKLHQLGLSLLELSESGRDMAAFAAYALDEYIEEAREAFDRVMSYGSGCEPGMTISEALEYESTAQTIPITRVFAHFENFDHSDAADVFVVSCMNMFIDYLSDYASEGVWVVDHDAEPEGDGSVASMSLMVESERVEALECLLTVDMDNMEVAFSGDGVNIVVAIDEDRYGLMITRLMSHIIRAFYTSEEYEHIEQ